MVTRAATPTLSLPRTRLISPMPHRIVQMSFRCLSMKACCRFPVTSRTHSTLSCSSIGRDVGIHGRRSRDAEPGSLARYTNAVSFNQLCAATVAARAGPAIDSPAAATIGAGHFLDAPQKAGADADRTVARGHDAMGASLQIFAAGSRRAIPFSGYTPSLKWLEARHGDPY